VNFSHAGGVYSDPKFAQDEIFDPSQLGIPNRCCQSWRRSSSLFHLKDGPTDSPDHLGGCCTGALALLASFFGDAPLGLTKATKRSQEPLRRNGFS